MRCWVLYLNIICVYLNICETFLAVASSQLLNGADDCFQPGQCMDSFHLSSDYTTDEYDCLENCNDDSLCNWFTFSPTQSICELLHNCSAIDVPSCPTCLTGQTGCAPGNIQDYITLLILSKAPSHSKPNFIFFIHSTNSLDSFSRLDLLFIEFYGTFDRFEHVLKLK